MSSEVGAARLMTRSAIFALQAAMEDLPTEEKIEPHVEHHFAPGCYGREIFMPAGSVVVGKIHRHAHLNVLLEGECEVVTEHERERLTAPHVWVSTPGIKRAVHNITDVRWITFHPTEETDLTKIEAEVIAPSYDNLIEEAI